MEYEEINKVVERFLKARFGDNMVTQYDCYEDSQFEGSRISGDLQELLEEFAEILTSDNLVQSRNPRSNEYVVVDKSKGTIVGHYVLPLL